MVSIIIVFQCKIYLSIRMLHALLSFFLWLLRRKSVYVKRNFCGWWLQWSVLKRKNCCRLENKRAFETLTFCTHLILWGQPTRTFISNSTEIDQRLFNAHFNFQDNIFVSLLRLSQIQFLSFTFSVTSIQ